MKRNSPVAPTTADSDSGLPAGIDPYSALTALARLLARQAAADAVRRDEQPLTSFGEPDHDQSK